MEESKCKCFDCFPTADLGIVACSNYKEYMQEGFCEHCAHDPKCHVTTHEVSNDK
jgi:hypothetical protein